MLEVADLVSGYGPVKVLHGLSISVDQGSTVAVLGPNGAGKSTLLKTIMSWRMARSVWSAMPLNCVRPGAWFK